MSVGSFFALASVACAKFHNFCQAIVATAAAARAGGATAAATVPCCLPLTCHSYRAINKTSGNVRTPSPSLHPPSLVLVLTGASFVICSPYFDLFYVHFPAPSSHLALRFSRSHTAIALVNWKYFLMRKMHDKPARQRDVDALRPTC